MANQIGILKRPEEPAHTKIVSCSLLAQHIPHLGNPYKEQVGFSYICIIPVGVGSGSGCREQVHTAGSLVIRKSCEVEVSVCTCTKSGKEVVELPAVGFHIILAGPEVSVFKYSF